MPVYLLTMLVALIASCEIDLSQVRQEITAIVSKVASKSAVRVSLKEIHLEGGFLTGKSVVVTGTIYEVNEHGTYIVVGDDTAHVLVVLTEVVANPEMAMLTKGQSVEVEGIVQPGSKGMSFVLASDVSPYNPDSP